MSSNESDTLTFHHGGRYGDLLYAMYTVKKICEKAGKKAVMKLSPYHTGWTKTSIKSIGSFIELLPYVDRVESYELPDIFNRRPLGQEEGIDYDLHAPERLYNPGDFPEWDRKSWPSNIHMAKRTAHYFDVDFDPSETWLEHIPWGPTHATRTVLIHYLERRKNRELSHIQAVANHLVAYGIRPIFIGTGLELERWHYSEECGFSIPSDFYETAELMSHAEAIICCGSSPYVLARGLGLKAFVDLSPECSNNYPLSPRDIDISKMRTDGIIAALSVGTAAR